MSFGHEDIIIGTGEGKTISVLGDSYTYKAAKKETGGSYALIEGRVVDDWPPCLKSMLMKKRPPTFPD